MKKQNREKKGDFQGDFHFSLVSYFTSNFPKGFEKIIQKNQII